MDDFELETAPKDLGRHRTLALENGNKVHFKCSDPYGFWTVNFDKGTMPDILTGKFTTYEYAEQAVRSYLNSKGKEPETETILFEPTKPQETKKKLKA